MTRQDFDELVRRISSRYRGRRRALERATDAWIAFGLAGLLSWLGLLVAAGVALFVLGVVQQHALGIVAIVAGVLILVYAIAQAGLILLVDLGTPEGHPLGPGEAPALVALLDGLRRELRCRPFDEVRIGMEFNASVRETPRLGVLGWSRTSLEIGLPLMMSLTAREAHAVLAHEFAHLSARHGRGSARIYRLNRTWGNVFEQMQRPATGGVDLAVRGVVSRFLDWYWPRLHARALVLSRLHEYQADAVAATVAGGEAVASSLWRIECLNPLIAERFWPGLLAESAGLPEPPTDVIARLRDALATPPEPADAARWAGRVVNLATNQDETHPAFPDRIGALGIPADDRWTSGFPAAVRPSAAEDLLGPDLAPIERELASGWRRRALAPWRERHRKALADARRRSAAVEPDPAADPPAAGAAALWESAREAIEARGVAQAEPLLRAVLGRDPDHPGAGVVLGQHLLGRGDPEGERLLLGVVGRRDENWMARACEALQEHFRGYGQVDRLREIRSLLDRFEADLAEARRERSTIRAGDPFSPHDLSAAEVRPLLDLLATTPGCEAAWLVRKDVRRFPDRPLFVLCVRASGPRWGAGRGDRDRDLVRRLIPRVELPGQALVISRQDGFRKLAARVMAIGGSEIYRSDKPELA